MRLRPRGPIGRHSRTRPRETGHNCSLQRQEPSPRTTMRFDRGERMSMPLPTVRSRAPQSRAPGALGAIDYKRFRGVSFRCLLLPKQSFSLFLSRVSYSIQARERASSLHFLPAAICWSLCMVAPEVAMREAHTMCFADLPWTGPSRMLHLLGDPGSLLIEG